MGGLLTLFAPCAALMLPGFLAYAAAGPRGLLVRSGIFTLGLIVALAPLGFLMGSLGIFLREHQGTLTRVVAVLVIIMGLWQAFALPIPHFGRKKTARASAAPTGSLGSAKNSGKAAKNGQVGLVSGVSLGATAIPRASAKKDAAALGGTSTRATAAGRAKTEVGVGTQTASSAANTASASRVNPLAIFSLGVGYGLAGVGCSTPILGAMLGMSGLGGSPMAGGFMMIAYGLGMATPIVILSLLWESLDLGSKGFLKPKPMKVLGRWTTKGAFFSGILFVILGVVLFFTYGHNFLPQIMSEGTQLEIETKVMAALAGVPSFLFVLLAVVMFALLWAWQRYYRK
ncbi:hypothetical protein BSR29_07540 [Boudabousia liubingyangii]|uniref:Uncharacterized protein n=1 Tax=Boudabousia liubingyangii TaxID=1921764 RepID=A0A1Q5PKB5_9ACTO|nr:hypothetical protein BSR29_07540 [Boudabousia liubingyangii]